MIVPTNTLSPEWQNENALRAYPLADDCKAAEVLPTWLITDLHITVDKQYDSVYVSSAYVSDTIVSVGISGVSGTGNPVGLLTKTVTLDELEAYKAYSMDRMAGSAAGAISFGEKPAGASSFKLTFTKDEAPIAESTITRITPPGVTRIIDKAYGSEATGIIDLSGNSEFRTYFDATDSTIVIELTDMYRDMTTSVCNSTPSFNACGQIPVKTISGVAPDSTGKITLRFK